MERPPDMKRLWEDLVDAFEWNEGDRLRALVTKLSAHRRQARAMLDEMLASEDARTRQAAVFALGEFGGTASLKRLERQMDIEQARADYDGSAVLQVITEALGRIKEVGARASLIRRLERLVAGKHDTTDLNDVAYALWRKRHPELIPVLRNVLDQLEPEESEALRALLQLLETPPDVLTAWVANTSVPLKDKRKILTILDEGVPDELLPVIPAFIATALTLGDAVLVRQSEAAYFCDRLFTTLLLHDKRVLPAIPVEARSELRSLARQCVPSASLNCAGRAVWILERVGHPADAELLEAHRPVDEDLAKEHDKSIEVIRNLPRE
jgi:hypothetical protein